MTRQDYRCAGCMHVEEYMASFGTTLHVHCKICGARMSRFFGKTSSDDVPINFGFRARRYASIEEARIAEFQFTNL